ncbi:FAD-binding oxidoreductase [Zoogloea sp. LCSB751]|uniref:FAD-binding oxidoreductase n=1 Tax=Zoogloea sp. LCSB751 TaxID=1965277 RepID=UPI0009A54CBD|nr:flavin reductase family protein [Zoogloea sp. LCSB751]
MTVIPPAGEQLFRLAEIHPLSDEVRRVVLSSVDGTPFPYQEGQFVCLRLPDGVQRSYSPASPCRNDGRIELHIRLLHGGHFSGWLTGDDRTGSVVSVSGPYGECVWRACGTPHSPVLMLGTGTGIAPLKALLEQALSADERRPITLYWGGRQESDLYLRDHFDALARRHAHFRFVPVLAEPTDSWHGQRGFVQDSIVGERPPLADATVYACGSPLMVASARAQLVDTLGLAPDRFLADAFVPAVAATAESSGHSALTVNAHANGQTHALKAAAGSPLMPVLAKAGLLAGVCGGQAACGTCRVLVPPPWSERLPRPDRQEARLLLALDSLPGHRLACRISMAADLDGLQLACG